MVRGVAEKHFIVENWSKEMSSIDSFSETKKLEDMSADDASNWIKSTFDETVAAKFRGRSNSIEVAKRRESRLCQI